MSDKPQEWRKLLSWAFERKSISANEYMLATALRDAVDTVDKLGEDINYYCQRIRTFESETFQFEITAPGAWQLCWRDGKRVLERMR